MGVVSLELEVQALKKEVEELKTKSVEEVFVQALEGFNNRLTRLEERVKGVEVGLGIVAKQEGEAGF